jgi:hypothetical protein
LGKIFQKFYVYLQLLPKGQVLALVMKQHNSTHDHKIRRNKQVAYMSNCRRYGSNPRAGGSVVVKVLCYKPDGRGIVTR